MNCGPSCYQMNWSVLGLKGQMMKVGLDHNLYDSFYKFHYHINDIFIQEGYLYIIHIEGSKNKIKLLRLNKELTDKTNFKDISNIFIKKGE